MDERLADGQSPDDAERAAILTSETPRAIIALIDALFARPPERLAA